MPNITRTSIHIEGVEHHMRHSSPTLPGTREFEADPSPHPPWMKRCQLLHHLWRLVDYRGSPGSRDILYVESFVKTPHWHRSRLSQFFFTLTASLKKWSAFWGSLQSSQVLPVLLAICKDWTLTNTPCSETPCTHRGWLQYCLPESACGWRPLLDFRAHSSTAHCMRHGAL